MTSFCQTGLLENQHSLSACSQRLQVLICCSGGYPLLEYNSSAEEIPALYIIVLIQGSADTECEYAASISQQPLVF